MRGMRDEENRAMKDRYGLREPSIPCRLFGLAIADIFSAIERTHPSRYPLEVSNLSSKKHTPTSFSSTIAVTQHQSPHASFS